jgi:hypothetical protein
VEASEEKDPVVPSSGEQESDNSTAAAPPAPWTEEQRRNALAQNLQQAVRKGWRVESQTEYQANLVKGHRTNHILHLILSIVTLGLWLIVWLIVALTNKEKRRVVTVDEYGRITG